MKTLHLVRHLLDEGKDFGCQSGSERRGRVRLLYIFEDQPQQPNAIRDIERGEIIMGMIWIAAQGRSERKNSALRAERTTKRFGAGRACHGSQSTPRTPRGQRGRTDFSLAGMPTARDMPHWRHVGRQNPCYTTQIMSIPEPELRPFQFTLRSLLLLAGFVAILCSIGVCTDWIVAVALAVGGITGGIVARKLSGLAIGAFFGMACAVGAAAVFGLLVFLLLGKFSLWDPRLNAVMAIAAFIGSLVGGAMGGLMARYLSGR